MWLANLPAARRIVSLLVTEMVFVVGHPLDAAGWGSWYAGRGQRDNRLYISRGIGFSAVPVRLFCPPEVTFFTLKR